MKICFPAQRNDGLKTMVFGHFGSAPLFLLVDSATGEIVGEISREPGHHAALSALEAKGVGAVVVSAIGGGALRGLAAANIAVYEAKGGSVGENATLFTAGKLSLWPEGKSCGCGHGGHRQGASHGCGHGSHSHGSGGGHSCGCKSHGHHPQGETPHEAGKSSFDLVDAGELLAALGARESDKIADLGCGSGNYALFIASKTGPDTLVHGVDLWEEGLKTLAEGAAAGGFGKVRGFRADLKDLSTLEEGFYDLALMGTVLHDLQERGQAKKALAEAARILKKGGKLAVVEFEKRDSKPGPPLKIRLSPEECAALARGAGFGEAGYFDLGPHLYLSVFRKI